MEEARVLLAGLATLVEGIQSLLVLVLLLLLYSRLLHFKVLDGANHDGVGTRRTAQRTAGVGGRPSGRWSQAPRPGRRASRGLEGGNHELAASGAVVFAGVLMVGRMSCFTPVETTAR